MTKIINSFVIFMLLVSFWTEQLSGQVVSSFGKMEEDIVKNIIKTSFPSDTLSIVSVGAVGDGISDCRGAIENAIETISNTGGGVVLIPQGYFYCKGPISLRSNINLHLTTGAKLLFSPHPEDFLPAVFTRWEGIEIYNYSPMIYTIGQENIAITGDGIISGNAKHEWTKILTQKGKANNLVREYGDMQVPVKERIFGEGDYLRPSMIQFINCKKILIEDITIDDSPFWMLHPVYCSDIIIRNVKFNSEIINNDGIDIDSSTDCLIENCTFITGDDAIAFKAGRDRDGRKVNKPTRNIVVRNCIAPKVLHGIAFGSEISAGIENIFIRNFHLGKVKEEAIQFKSNKDRGGYIRNINIKDVSVDSVGARLFYFTNGYFLYRGGNEPSLFSDIIIQNVNCLKANCVFYLQGLPEMPLRNLRFKNINVKIATEQFGKKEYYENLQFERIQINRRRLTLPLKD
jgi:polygalacturonase